VCVMIGTTSFDGFTLGPSWGSAAPWLQDRFRELGLDAIRANELVFTVGLLVGVAMVFGFYRLGAWGIRSVGGDRSTEQLARLFAHGLIPIALAYVIAHYFGLLASEGQAMGYLVSDPLGRGWDVFGTARASIDYGWISASAIWYVQVVALVVGHVAGLTLAHDRALATYDTARAATQSQYWMLAVMVGFTSLALWLLSAGA
ncbi:MAG: fenitrothion hydrolase, partial [Actinomycetota bacterium]|nr:fenitrothion hydrolase [Actinomycetota bacterium]